MSHLQATILIGENNGRITSDYGSLLSTNGYAIRTVSNGADLVDLIKRGPVPDLIVIDDNLENPPAFDVVRSIKAQSSFSSIPILLLASPFGTLDAAKAIQAGCDDILSPPILPHVLHARVESLLRLKFQLDELDDAERVLYTLVRTIEVKDRYTMGHADRVAQYAMALGKAMGLSPKEQGILYKGGLLHDIGKIAIPDSILSKPGSLTPEEFDTMKKHPVLGWEICEKLHSIKDALPLIRHHHEKIDGTGYPDQLSGGLISLLVRAISIVDVYDALRSERSYKAAFSIDKTFEILWSETTKGWWDKDILTLWEKIVREPKSHSFPI